MDRAGKILELEALMENLLKSHKNSGLLRLKILYFANIYENLSVSMIIDKLGIKKSNFALMTTELEKEGLIETKKAEIDRRCRTINLTEKGRKELSAYMQDVETALGSSSLEADYAISTLLTFFNKKL